jgi:hypothetical protein
VTVALQVRRGRRTLARRRGTELAAGRHTLEVRLPRKTTAGRARLAVTFATAGGARHTSRLPVLVPARG